MIDPRLLLLDPRDNVLVAIRTIPAGASLSVDGREILVEQDIGLGHKVAARNIEAGEKIVKYRSPIGSTTRFVAAGEHVHLHNMKSDYLPTYTLESGRTFSSHANH